VVDGGFGLFARDRAATFTALRIRSSDAALAAVVLRAPVATVAAPVSISDAAGALAADPGPTPATATPAAEGTALAPTAPAVAEISPAEADTAAAHSVDASAGGHAQPPRPAEVECAPAVLPPGRTQPPSPRDQRIT